MKKACAWRKALLCVMLFALIGGLIGGAARAEEAVRPRNASGTWNVAPAIDLLDPTENYSTVLYDNRNGMPTSEANAIVQTEDGFIWIGSYAGLIRYDGETFERMDSTGGLTSIKCLYVDSSGRLWIGTNDNGAAVLENHAFRFWGKQEGLKSAHIRAIAEDASGVIYVATTRGIARIHPDGSLSILEDPAVAEADMRDIRMGSDGLLYGTTDTGDLMILRDGQVLRWIEAEENPIGSVGTILPDPETPGRIYMETEDFGLYHVDLREGFTVLERMDPAPLKYLNALEMIGGELWLCAGNGIGVLRDGTFHVLDDLPVSNSVSAVMTDYQGNLWFTSTRQGVMKAVPNQFIDLSARYGLSDTVVNTTCLWNGLLFIGSDTGLTVAGETGLIDRLPLTKAETASGVRLETEDLIGYLQGSRIRSIIRDSRDRLWISTWRSVGLLRYDHGELTAFTEEEGLCSTSIRAVYERADGSMLVALVGGLNLIEEDRVVASRGSKDGIGNTASLTVCEAPWGDAVLGSNGGGMYIIRESGVRKIDVEDGLPSDIVLRVKPDAKHNLVWIVTSNAIAYLTPDGRVTAVRQFPYANNFDLFLTGDGNMWILSSNGLYVLPAEDMIANQEINPVYYGIDSGLPFPATANSYSELTADGDLYIAGSEGVCRVNVMKPLTELRHLKITVPFLDVDGKRIYPDASGGFTVPFRSQKLTVYPYIFFYSLLDPQITLCMEGVDAEEMTFSRSTLEPVVYTNLPAGSWQFSVRVKSAAGGEGSSLSVPVVKEPPLTDAQSGIVIMDLVSLICLIGILIYSSAYMKRDRADDLMFRLMAVTNIAVDLMEIVTYLWEARLLGEIRVIAYANYTLMYLSLSLFMYFFVMHLHFRVHQDQNRAPRAKTFLLYGIPFGLLALLMAVNLATGWIFRLAPGNTFVRGPAKGVEFIPIFLYLAIAVSLTWKVSRRLVALGFALLLIRLALQLWMPEISSIALMYTILVICAYTHQMNRSILETDAVSPGREKG